MNPDLGILRDLIKDEALVTVKKNRHGGNFLELKEPGGGKLSGYILEVLNTPEDAIAIKSDVFSSPKKIFKNTKGECKRADFVIIAKGEKKNWIIYIEMKRSNYGSEKEIIQQLQGSRCFIDYCRTVGQTFWRESGFLEEEAYLELYVSVKNIGVDKRPSRGKRKSSLHDRPENMLKINAPSKKGVQFKNLLAKS